MSSSPAPSPRLSFPAVSLAVVASLLLVAPPAHASDQGLEPTTSWSDPGTFLQTYVLDRQANVVTIVERGNRETTGSLRSCEFRGHASFRITHVASGRKDHFLVAGIARDGDVVFETWTLEPWSRTGSRDEPCECPDKELRRAEVFRGSLEGSIVTMDYDAEGRFALFLTEEEQVKVLYRLTVESGKLVEVADSRSLPELGWMQGIQKFQHATLGRVWELSALMAPAKDWIGDQTPAALILFVDGDNDGAFEGPPILKDAKEAGAGSIMALDLWDPLKGPR